MLQKICFILNAATITAEVHPGMLLVDFLRYHKRLTGTKIGCREGDCGACTVLLGERPDSEGPDSEVVYANVTSCLVPMGNVAGKHVVTIEAVSGPELNAIQAAFVEEGATQCGFCTPGFIMSLLGHCLERKPRDATAAISGNICRCTGYKSIERAVRRVEDHLRDQRIASPADLVRTGMLPSWFASIPARLVELTTAETAETAEASEATDTTGPSGIPVGGGTDLFVRRPEELAAARLRFRAGRGDRIRNQRDIRLEADTCVVGASVTVEELARSTLLGSLIPHLPRFASLFGSQPIRNMATLAGNLANASPIGDMTILFLALDASLDLRIGDRRRRVALRDFYRGYKGTDLQRLAGSNLAEEGAEGGAEEGAGGGGDEGGDEVIESVTFAIPRPGTFVNFEKVSKRTHLDIASVNTAIRCHVADGTIVEAHCSAGGVAPVPLYLAQTSRVLRGKPLDAATVRQAAAAADAEIAPIDDVRGSAEYKRLLLRQLIYAHFLPHGIAWGDLR